MKTVVAFEDPALDKENNLLIIETGSRHCCYALFNKKHQQFRKLEFWQHEAWEAENSFNDIVEKAAVESFSSAVITTAFPEAILVPDKFGSKTGKLLQRTYHIPSCTAFQDRVEQKNLTIAYQLSNNIVDVARKFFKAPGILHSYTASLRQQKKQDGTVINVRFSGYEFSVIVETNDRLLLAQTYTYTTPLDVIYYLLKICYEFGIDQTDVALQLAGFVEKDSSLYGELNQYFSNISFASTPQSLTTTDHPAYYFQPLYNIALCAS